MAGRGDLRADDALVLSNQTGDSRVADSRADEIEKLERKLANAESELSGWERRKSQEHIKMGRVLVSGLREKLNALRSEN
jgi:hypothetical protein